MIYPPEALAKHRAASRLPYFMDLKLNVTTNLTFNSTKITKHRRSQHGRPHLPEFLVDYTLVWEYRASPLLSDRPRDSCEIVDGGLGFDGLSWSFKLLGTG